MEQPLLALLQHNIPGQLRLLEWEGSLTWLLLSGLREGQYFCVAELGRGWPLARSSAEQQALETRVSQNSMSDHSVS